MPLPGAGLVAKLIRPQHLRGWDPVPLSPEEAFHPAPALSILEGKLALVAISGAWKEGQLLSKFPEALLPCLGVSQGLGTSELPDAQSGQSVLTFSPEQGSVCCDKEASFTRGALHSNLPPCYRSILALLPALLYHSFAGVRHVPARPLEVPFWARRLLNPSHVSCNCVSQMHPAPALKDVYHHSQPTTSI